MHRRDIKELCSDIDDPTPTLWTAKKKGKDDITSYMPGKSKNQTVWGLKSWINSDGKPKAEHVFDDKVLLIK